MNLIKIVKRVASLKRRLTIETFSFLKNFLTIIADPQLKIIFLGKIQG